MLTAPVLHTASNTASNQDPATMQPTNLLLRSAANLMLSRPSKQC